MVIDSLNLKLVSNFTNLLRLAETSGGRWQYWAVQMESEIARLAAWWKKIFFYSIHVWYNLPKIVKQGTPQDWDVGPCTDGDSDCRDLHGGR